MDNFRIKTLFFNLTHHHILHKWLRPKNKTFQPHARNNSTHINQFLYYYLLFATIEADDFAINNKNKKNSTKFLIPLGWECSTSWHTYCPNSFCSHWFSPDSKAATIIKQLSIYFAVCFGSLNTGPYKANFFQVQFYPISHAMYESLKLSHSWNTRPCSNHSRRTWIREPFSSLNWDVDVIPLCGYEFLMAT